jgi:hypothetical protein
VEVCPLDGYCLRLRFEDGTEGIVDVSKIVEFTGMFAPLRERAFFLQVRVNPELGTICWPNEAEMDPDVLYALVRNESLPTFRERASSHTIMTTSG